MKWRAERAGWENSHAIPDGEMERSPLVSRALAEKMHRGFPMTVTSTFPQVQATTAPEHVILGFSLRLHLLYRGLLRDSLSKEGKVSTWTICAAEAVNDLHHAFVVFTRARLERPFAAMHGREMRRWEAYLAKIIRYRDIEGASTSRDFLEEMKGIAESGEKLLPYLYNRSAQEMARMLSRYRRSLAQIEGFGSVLEAKIFLLRNGEKWFPNDWDAVLTRILREQGGEFSPMKRGSWRCFETALSDVAVSLSLPPLPTVPARETRTGRSLGAENLTLRRGRETPPVDA